MTDIIRRDGHATVKAESAALADEPGGWRRPAHGPRRALWSRVSVGAVAYFAAGVSPEVVRPDSSFWAPWAS